ncbi:MAG TPA: cytochrome b N-terminal domain-containing protein [Candidatus Brocadiia bacterium]|nr:cytochrome b N-terminal domain-containing protein [Planctomycetota bacterium]MBI4007416.1 cytochrome b N-terminal domain-containing protein [Planctomycetota bacterium]MDO8094381.1 cytochrome b N-terminal domain-containing protein [Candidatus Brocadiales bacterium]
MATKLIQDIIETVTNSQIWKSFFRRKHDDRNRSRMLAVIANFFMHLHPATIARHGIALKYTWCMGGTTTFLFLFLTLTGVLLMFYYRPTTLNAFNDIKELEYSVPFGMMLRNTHRWGAHLMVITVMLHMFRVFMTGAYKPPREFNWVIGVVLLVITFLLSFSGYLLTWDQLGMWAITVGTNMARATPFIGHEGPFGEQLGMTPYNDIRFAILGGSTVGANALLRAYIWHCIAFPLILTIFLAVHFWRVRKDGGISGPL